MERIRRQRPSTLKRQNGALLFILGGFLGHAASSFFAMVTMYDSLKVSSLGPMVSSSADDQKTTVMPEEGWGSVNVYYGNASYIVESSTIPNDYHERTMWFSQVRQDYIVSRLLRKKRNGYFVDLAANDAIRISNTYALEQNLDWRGLCIEPNPAYWSALSHRKCDVIAAVIGNVNDEEVQFRFPEKAPRGGIVGPAFDNKETTGRSTDRVQKRLTISLQEIFRKFRTPTVIDYLSLDIEGAEDFVMESFPFDSYRVNVLTIERPNDKLKILLKKNGYMLLKELKKWGETLWIHESIVDDIDKTALSVDTMNYKYREH